MPEFTPYTLAQIADGSADIRAIGDHTLAQYLALADELVDLLETRYKSSTAILSCEVQRVLTVLAALTADNDAVKFRGTRALYELIYLWGMSEMVAADA